MICRPLLTMCAAALWLLPSSILAAPMPPAPGHLDKCPVCGMFITKYPSWTAALSFSDGTHAYFDGAKDLFVYLNNLPRYAKGRTSAMVAGIWVKDYYSLRMIDAKSSWYVIGSTVYGPMGHELIPFVKQADAQEFMKDYDGKRIIRYPEITPTLLKTLE